MKSYKYILLSAIVISVASCKKWLDVKPTAELDSSEIFSSERGYREALTGVYANLTKPELYGREMTWGTMDVVAGNYGTDMWGNYRSLAEYGYKRANSDFADYTLPYINPIWSGIYTQIANLNSLLETIDGNKNVFQADNYNLFKGEALGLRAFLHLELLSIYGPSYASGGASTQAIPYINKLTTLISPIITVDSAMVLIIKDLQDAKKLLTNDPIHMASAPTAIQAPIPVSPYSSMRVGIWHNRRFTFNYYAATGALARAYLWKGDKVNALLQAKEIIQDQSTRFPWVVASRVVPPSSSTSAQDRTFASEHIFALNIKRINEYMDGLIFQGAVRISFPLSPQAYTSGNVFEGSTDIRRNNLSTNYSGGIIVSNKFHQVFGTNPVYSFFQERVPLMRSSEMFYIAAECEPDLAQARLYLDSVRAKRGLSNAPLNPNISRSELDIEIRKEYQKEFIGEGRLWFYQKRNNLNLAVEPSRSIFNTSDRFQMNAYVFDRPDDEDGNR